MIEEPIKYIQKVEISGLWGRYDIDWNLHSDVNVLAGGNGSGKTTILNSIYKLLKGITPNKTLENINILFDNKKNIYFEWFEVPDKTIDGFDRTILLGQCSVENLDGINKVIDIKLISTFDSEARTQEQIAKEDKEAKTELDFQLSRLQREYTKYQVRIYKYDSEINRATHKRFLAMLDKLLAETNKRVNPDKEELEFLLGDTKINAYQLSSGEKQLLIILLTVLVQDNKPSILLMDEPEISLHFEWQENLINYVRELNPNAQLIIATHSADLIMKGWGNRVFELSKLTMKDRLAS